MSRILGLGKKANIYKQLKQVPSDDDIDSCEEEYTVFDKNDRSTIQLQLVPSATQDRNRQTEEVNIKRAKTNWGQCLLLLGVIIVAICGLVVGIVLVRLLKAPLESRTGTVNINHTTTTQSESHISQTVTEATKLVTGIETSKLVTESNSVEDVTLSSEDIALSSDETIKWEKTWKDVSSESCVRLLDVDGDGLDDILLGTASSGGNYDVEATVGTGKYGDLRDFCHQQGENYPCQGHIIALRGYDGQLLWNLTVRSEVFLMNCEHFDLDLDGKPDCIGTGRKGVVVAFNPYTGHLYWSAEDDAVFNAGWNTYQAVPLPDWDKDGVSEVLIANGGEPRKGPEDHDRDAGRLVVLSGRTGQMVGERYLEMPNSKETYMSPVLYHRHTGTDIILFGSGGETVPGDLMGIPVTSLCHYIYGEEAINKCLPEEAEKGLFVIVSGVEKGVMVPPVIIDVDGDSVDDILISMFEGKLVLKNGWDLSVMWTASFPGTETYSTPAPGYFDDDDIIDFMVHLSKGTWPRYNSSSVTVISGKDGSVLWTLDSSFFEMNSDLVIQTSEPHRDLFLFKLKGRGSPYSHMQSGEIIREGGVKRKKRHGEAAPLPAHNGIPPGTHYDKNYFAQEYRKFHITCDDDLTNHRGEIFLVDRSSMKQPLKILDIPLKKTWYDAPVATPVPPPRHDNNENRKNQTQPTSHMGVQIKHPKNSGSDGPMRDPRVIVSAHEQMCVLMDSDDRSTGAVADLDGDGILEYISIYTSFAQTVDTMYSYYAMMFTFSIKVINLNLLSDNFKSISVPSASSFTLNQPLKDMRNIHTMPYSDQKWTQYMGKHGDNHHRDQD